MHQNTGKIVNFSYPTHLVTPVKFHQNLWYKKTRVTRDLAQTAWWCILIQKRHVIDGETNRWTPHHTTQCTSTTYVSCDKWRCSQHTNYELYAIWTANILFVSTEPQTLVRCIMILHNCTPIFNQ